MDFVFTKLPYFTFGVFIIGLIWRLIRFFGKGIQSHPIFPYAKIGTFKRVSTYLSQILLFTPIFRSDRTLWTISWAFHLSLVLILAGHIRMFAGIKINEKLAFLLGSFFGLIFLISMLILLLRRFGEAKVISTTEDYLVLLLLISIAVSGLLMRFSGHHYNLTAYILSIVSFSPIPPRYDSLLLIHFLLAQILIAYLPYGKLFHSVGAFVTSYLPLRWQNA